MTTYTEVGPDDTDVALFLVERLQRINVWHLPRKAWVAREDGKIVVVLTFENNTYPAIHFIVADETSRPFMRLYKIWMLAKSWFESVDMPMVCAPVFNHLRHFQSLLRRYGFVKIGEERIGDTPTETIYAYYFKEYANENSVPASD